MFARPQASKRRAARFGRQIKACARKSLGLPIERPPIIHKRQWVESGGQSSGRSGGCALVAVGAPTRALIRSADQFVKICISTCARKCSSDRNGNPKRDCTCSSETKRSQGKSTHCLRAKPSAWMKIFALLSLRARARPKGRPASGCARQPFNWPPGRRMSAECVGARVSLKSRA